MVAVPSGHALHLPVWEISKLRLISHTVVFGYRLVGGIVASLLYHLSQTVGLLNPVPPAVIAVGDPGLSAAIYAISIRADLLECDTFSDFLDPSVTP